MKGENMEYINNISSGKVIVHDIEKEKVDFAYRSHLKWSKISITERIKYIFKLEDVNAGNIEINSSVAAPIALYPFAGYKDSLFGDLHAQTYVMFYTDNKVVINRW